MGVWWACSSGTSTLFPPRGGDVRDFLRVRRTSLQNVSQVISRPASESRCQICLCVFPERSATSISNKREQRRAVFVAGGLAASFPQRSRGGLGGGIRIGGGLIIENKGLWGKRIFGG